MGDVVNLNQYRKERARTHGKKRAAENRVRHGLSKTERNASRQERDREERQLDAKLLEASRPKSDEPPTAG